MEFSITLVIVILTCLVSIGGFTQQKIVDDLIFYPPAIHQRHQYYRFITHGLIHADLIHLAFNMLALYSFGVVVEKVYSFDCIFGEKAKLFYLLLYFLGMIMASLPDYFKYRESYQFKSLGASGAVSAVIFSTVVFFPQNPIGLFFIPVQVPGFVFAILYLAISVYLDKRGGGRVNHSAHFWGAAFGIAFTLVFCQVFANGFNVYDNFMQQLHSMKRVLPIECDY